MSWMWRSVLYYQFILIQKTIQDALLFTRRMPTVKQLWSKPYVLKSKAHYILILLCTALFFNLCVRYCIHDVNYISYTSHVALTLLWHKKHMSGDNFLSGDLGGTPLIHCCVSFLLVKHWLSLTWSQRLQSEDSCIGGHTVSKPH